MWITELARKLLETSCELFGVRIAKWKKWSFLKKMSYSQIEIWNACNFWVLTFLRFNRFAKSATNSM